MLENQAYLLRRESRAVAAHAETSLHEVREALRAVGAAGAEAEVRRAAERDRLLTYTSGADITRRRKAAELQAQVESLQSELREARMTAGASSARLRMVTATHNTQEGGGARGQRRASTSTGTQTEGTGREARVSHLEEELRGMREGWERGMDEAGQAMGRSVEAIRALEGQLIVARGETAATLHQLAGECRLRQALHARMQELGIEVAGARDAGRVQAVHATLAQEALAAQSVELQSLRDASLLAAAPPRHEAPSLPEQHAPPPATRAPVSARHDQEAAHERAGGASSGGGTTWRGHASPLTSVSSRTGGQPGRPALVGTTTAPPHSSARASGHAPFPEGARVSPPTSSVKAVKPLQPVEGTAPPPGMPEARMPLTPMGCIPR